MADFVEGDGVHGVSGETKPVGRVGCQRKVAAHDPARAVPRDVGLPRPANGKVPDPRHPDFGRRRVGDEREAHRDLSHAFPAQERCPGGFAELGPVALHAAGRQVDGERARHPVRPPSECRVPAVEHRGEIGIRPGNVLQNRGSGGADGIHIDRAAERLSRAAGPD